MLNTKEKKKIITPSIKLDKKLYRGIVAYLTIIFHFLTMQIFSVFNSQSVSSLISLVSFGGSLIFSCYLGIRITTLFKYKYTNQQATQEENDNILSEKVDGL